MLGTVSAWAQDSVCPGQTGEAAIQCIQANYSPTATLGYGSARDVLFRDIDAAASGELEGIYSGFTITLTEGEDPTEDAFSKGINTEHVFPQSKGAGTEPRRSDMHNLYPARAAVNNARSNIPFGESPDADTDAWYRGAQVRSSPPASDVDAWSERLGASEWEPREAREGDVARAALYFFAVYRSAADPSFFEEMKDQLVRWHEADPVTAAEEARSQAIAQEQGNENPFVLDATLAARAFGGQPSGPTLAFAPTRVQAGEAAGSATLTVRYANPDGEAVDVEVAFDAGLSSASTDDIGGFSAQTVSFPASAPDGATRAVTIPLTDDDVQEGREEAYFQLQNVQTAGGAAPGTESTAVLTIEDDEAPPLVINEVLADPASGTAGDANGDGTRSATEDEFVEIYNRSASETVDLGGYEYVDEGVGVRHVFPAGTALPPETAIVVFGGGAPADQIPSRVQTASTGTLALNNGGDAFRITNAAGIEVLAFSYDGSTDDESLTRNPSFTGSFVPHTEAETGVLFSPGRTPGGTALPVELARFRAQTDGREAVLLRWTTASETRNAGFRVERRAGGGSWRQVGYRSSKAPGGTSTEALRYRYRDAGVPFAADTARYRLTQIDTDGRASRSRRVEVALGAVDKLRLEAPYPNPTQGVVTLELAVPQTESGRATLRLYNVLGQKVLATHVGEGRQQTQLQTDRLASGVYVLRLTTSSDQVTRKITVVQ